MASDEHATVGFNLSAKDIEQLLVNAVLDSSLGDEVRLVVGKHIEALKNGGPQSLLALAIREQVSKIITDMVQTEFSEAIKEAAREQLSDEVLADLVKNAINTHLSWRQPK